MTTSSTLTLKSGHELHWYKIKNVLGQGAFGITYLAYDMNLDRDVAVKEYLPEQFAGRNVDGSVKPTSEENVEDFEWGLKRFISEARTLTRFEHPNLVKVFNIFEMNNTAYMVMNYELGKSLQQILKNRKTLNESEIIKILRPLMDGLEIMHAQGFVHRDIKPGNIFIRTNGSPVLLDFGSARQTRLQTGRDDNDESKTLTTLVSPGYAPIEQYGSRSDRQGPWTDIYGLGATLYRSVTGIMPVSAIDRSEAIIHDIADPYIPIASTLKDRYSDSFLAAIDHAMAFKANDRPQSMVEWRNNFDFTEINIDKVSESLIQTDSSDIPTVRIESSEEATFDLSAQNTIKTEPLETDATTIQRTKAQKLSSSTHKRKLLILLACLVLILFGALLFINNKEDAFSTQQVPHELQTQTQTRIEKLLMKAQEDINALRLTSPEENNAFKKYLSILELDENNQAAISGIQTISDKYIDLAYSAINSNKIDHADSYLKKAKAITPESEKIAAAYQALEIKRSELRTSNSLQTTDASAEQSNESFWSSVKKWHKEETEKNKQREKTEKNAQDERIKEAFGM